MQNLTMLNQDGLPPVASLRVGDFKSTTSGGGMVLQRSGAQTAIRRLYVDDAGAVLYGSGSVPDLRGDLTRILLTTDHTGGDVRVHAVMGQIKAYNAKWNDEVVSAVHGRMELVRASGTQTLGGYGVSAPVLGVISNSGAVTVNTNHVLAGLATYSDFDSSLTQTGVVAGVYVGLYDYTNWSDSSRTRVAFGHGIYIDASAATTGITLNACTTGLSFAGAVTTGISISGNATDGIKISGGTVVDAIEIGACTNAINVSGNVTKGLLIAGNATDGVYIGGGTVVDGIEIGATSTNGINISGVQTGTAILIAGTSVAGLKITGAATTAIDVDSCTTALDFAATGTGITGTVSTLHATTGRAMKLDGSVAAAAHEDGYGVVEINAIFSGAMGGPYGCASSTWINFAAGSTPSGIVAVRNDGIYLPTGITATAAKMIMGGRFHYVADDGSDPGSLFLFSTNIFDNKLTAILDINSIHDLNDTTAKSGGGIAIPFAVSYGEAPGTVYYINVYTS